MTEPSSTNQTERPEDRRQGLRVQTSFWVRIVGRDSTPRLCHGDVSISGVYFDSDTRLGGPGAVELLEIHSEDRSASFQTLACLVRVSTVEDLVHGTLVKGVAFEFLPDDEVIQRAIASAVHYITHAFLDDPQRLLEALRLNASISQEMRALRGDEEVVESSDRLATVAAVQGRGLVLETDWPIEAGAVIKVAIALPAQDEPMELEGVVAASVPSTHREDTYRVQVALGEPAEAGRPPAITSLVDGLNAIPRARTTLQRAPHLLGDLSRVPLALVLSLLDTEKLSARIELQAALDTATVFVCNGRVYDVYRPGLTAPPLVLVEEILMWKEGSFTVTVEEVDRTDELRVPTRELLQRFLSEDTEVL